MSAQSSPDFHEPARSGDNSDRWRPVLPVQPDPTQPSRGSSIIFHESSIFNFRCLRFLLLRFIVFTVCGSNFFFYFRSCLLHLRARTFRFLSSKVSDSMLNVRSLNIENLTCFFCILHFAIFPPFPICVIETLANRINFMRHHLSSYASCTSCFSY